MKKFVNYCMKAMASYVENMDRINHPYYYNYISHLTGLD